MRNVAIVAACALPLSACATASFAPPGIKVNYADGSGSTMTCRQAANRESDRTVTVARDVRGALTVVETYIDAFDCSARAAADGRQAFEVPGFLTATGAAVAAALGAGPNLAILATGASSTVNAGKAYYDPKRKALIYSHAVDALRCIRSEAMGIDNFAMFKTESDTATNNLAMAIAAGEAPPAPTVSVSAQEQYFTMVTNAAGSVAGILGDNLSNVGTYNPAGTAAELEKLLKEIQDAQDAKDEAETPPEPPEPPEPPPAGASAGARSAFAAIRNQQLDAWSRAMAEWREDREAKMIDVDLKLLQPKLQACVWRAKV